MRRSLALIAFLLALAPLTARAGDKAAKVELLEPGRGPRQPLRYALETGATETAVMRMALRMKTDGGPVPMDVVMPAIVTEVTTNLGEKRGADELLMTFSVDDLRLEDQPGQMDALKDVLSGLLDKMKGMTGSAFVSTRGVTREASFRVPPGVSPEIRQMLEQTEDGIEQMSAPLPVEAVGKGARWRIRMDLVRGGIALTQTLTYQVVSITADKVKMKVEITQSAKPQVVTTAAATYKLVKYGAKGSGTVELDLRHLVPASHLTLGLDQVVDTGAGAGAEAKMHTRVDMTMDIARR